jgi:hypothetical protein
MLRGQEKRLVSNRGQALLEKSKQKQAESGNPAGAARTTQAEKSSKISGALRLKSGFRSKESARRTLHAHIHGRLHIALHCKPCRLLLLLQSHLLVHSYLLILRNHLLVSLRHRLLLPLLLSHRLRLYMLQG